jgi:hypothetical protein
LKLVKGSREGEWYCASDLGIRFARSIIGRSWLAQIRRPRGESQRILVIVATEHRTLAEAVAWARQHWQPDFLGAVHRRLESRGTPEARVLWREALQGDLAALLALLDLFEEDGWYEDRQRILVRARRARLISTEVAIA